MQFGAAPVLRHRRVLESRNPDQTRAFMQAKEFHLDLQPREVDAFDFASSALYMPGGYIGYVQYGSAATVRVPAERRRDDYFIHLPFHGSSEVTNRAGSIVCSARQAVISPPTGHVTRSESGSARITVSLTRSAIVGQLAALLGDSPKQALEFAPVLDLDSAGGQRFGRHVQLAIADFDDEPTGDSPLMLTMYEQLIMTGLLLYHSNNYSDALHRRTPNVPRCGVARAIDYMQAHLASPITLADIVSASGVPGRTLLKHFRDNRGVSPMRYLQHARLVRAREALLAARPDEGVTQIALAWGFAHLGRFAIEYRRLFGESPSETLRRRGSPGL
jgi:AraC-like DNA-binding protein